MPSAPTSTRHTDTTRGRRRTLLIALTVIGVLGIAAVLYSALSAPTKPTATAPPGANPGNASAPAALTARTLDGSQVTVPDTRPSVLLFFSVECGGCGPTAQALAQAQQAFGDKATFAFIDIAVNETDTDVKGFLTQNQATTVAYAIDTDTQWIRKYRINQLTTVVVLNGAGTEVFRAVEPSAERIRAELAKVTAQ